MIKQLPEGFKGQFECLGENTEKYISFSVPIIKEVVNDDDDDDDDSDDHDDDDDSDEDDDYDDDGTKKKKIEHKLKFIDSYRCHANYQLVLITYQEYMIRIANHARKTKISK